MRPDVWAGPYGPGCGEPSYKCNSCGHWLHDEDYTGPLPERCPKCGSDGKNVEPPKPAVVLYDTRLDGYPNERGAAFRTLQVRVCPVCESKTNRCVMGEHRSRGHPTERLPPVPVTGRR